MTDLYFAYPGDLNTPTGGYGYDRKIIEGLQNIGWEVETVGLGTGFPFPEDATRTMADRRLADVPDGALLLIDGLAFGALPASAAKLGKRLRLVALVHHPLCLEHGLSESEKKSLRESENEALKHVRHVVVTSPATASQLGQMFTVPGRCITTVVPGTVLPENLERKRSDPAQLLSVGTVVPRKGYDLLLKALHLLAKERWQLTIVGGLQSDPEYHQSLVKLSEELNLADRITFRGSVAPDALSDLYRSADIFVLASRYEGYGMAYTEALAHGLPVVGSGAGAVADTLSGAGAFYCGVENVDAIRDALGQLIRDPLLWSEMTTASREMAGRLPTWSDAVHMFDSLLKDVGK